MKQLGKNIALFFIFFSIIVIVSCKKEKDTHNFLERDKQTNKQIKKCLQKRDSAIIEIFTKKLIADLKIDTKLANNYFHKKYTNPDIIVLENLIKYKIISKEIGFKKNNKCNRVYVNFNILTEEFIDDEGTKHNIEYSIILEIQKVNSEIKIIKILASG